MLIIETLRLEHQPEKAMAEAETAVKNYPKNQELAITYATMLGEGGHVDEAVAQLQPFITNRPIDRSIYISIAQIYLQAKRFDDAEKAIQKALDLSPSPEDQEYALFVQGSIFERQKKYDQAEQTFKKVLSVDPLNSSASNYLGYMLADRGVRLDESVKYIQKALSLEPGNAAYLDSLGWAYFKMGRYDLAESPLEKAADQDSERPYDPRASGQSLFAPGQNHNGAGRVAARSEGMARSRFQRFRRRAGQAASEATRRPQESLGRPRLRTHSCRMSGWRPKPGVQFPRCWDRIFLSDIRSVLARGAISTKIAGWLQCRPPGCAATLPKTLRVRAFAKINAGLKILRKRPDGYHELRTIYQTIGLHDRVEISHFQVGEGH